MSSIEPRNPRIDCLRGIAIGCVLLLHSMLAYGLKGSLLGSLLSPLRRCWRIWPPVMGLSRAGGRSAGVGSAAAARTARV
ncbi:hypothetical protein [Chromobacterium sp. CV08]|uniref:hypothetical protein n=1 Tax=Chromobacterium sp. CV08 TaxID=3133274 RepID=UPI003DA903E2